MAWSGCIALAADEPALTATSRPFQMGAPRRIAAAQLTSGRGGWNKAGERGDRAFVPNEFGAEFYRHASGLPMDECATSHRPFGEWRSCGKR
jgi:hypothetical protein